MKTKLYLYIIIAVVVLLVVGKIATAMNTAGDNWVLYYDGLDVARSIIWVGVRNQSRHLQQFTLDTLDLKIKDANNYEYELWFRYDLPWRSLPQRSDSNLTDREFEYPSRIIIPPGASFLVPYRYSMPENAPSPKIVLSKGFLGIGARTVSLSSPETGFASNMLEIGYNPIVSKKKDVTVEIGRAWWWDECVVVVEVRIENRGGGTYGWHELGTVDLWGTQLAENSYGNAYHSECPQTAVAPSEMFSPTTQWWVRGYSDAVVYYFFVPHPVDVGRDSFTLATYSVVSHPDSWIIPSFWTTLEEHHITSLQVLEDPPNDAPSVPTNDSIR